MKPLRRLHLSDDSTLLNTRFCDLRVDYAKSEVAKWVKQLQHELTAKKILHKPHVWFSTEWFSPDHHPGIAIPFYLAHPRLAALEKKMMFEVEGGRKKDALKILRHEAGHTVCTAYKLHYQKQWRKIFGSPAKPYPTSYTPKPVSKNYVLHLGWWYAQAHPDEDFAETFAVWLATPKAVWSKQYRDWPALKKLQYVDELMTSLAGKKPQVTSKKTLEPLASLKQTLRTHYQNRRKTYAKQLPDLYDKDLFRLFSRDQKHKRHKKASQFLRENRDEIRHILARWTREHEYPIQQVLDIMIERCQNLGLRVGLNDAQTKLNTLVMVTVQIMNILYKSRRAVVM